MPLPGDDEIARRSSLLAKRAEVKGLISDISTINIAMKNNLVTDDELRIMGYTHHQDVWGRDAGYSQRATNPAAADPANQAYQSQRKVVKNLARSMEGRAAAFQAAQSQGSASRFLLAATGSLGEFVGGLLSLPLEAGGLLASSLSARGTSSNQVSDKIFEMSGAVRDLFKIPGMEDPAVYAAWQQGLDTSGAWGHTIGNLATLAASFAVAPESLATTGLMSKAAVGRGAATVTLGSLAAGLWGYHGDGTQMEKIDRGLAWAGGVALAGSAFMGRPAGIYTHALQGAELEAPFVQGLGGAKLAKWRLGQSLFNAPDLTVGTMIRSGSVGAISGYSQARAQGAQPQDALLAGVTAGMQFVGYDVAFARMGGISRTLENQTRAARGAGMKLMSLGIGTGTLASLGALGGYAATGDPQLAATFGVGLAAAGLTGAGIRSARLQKLGMQAVTKEQGAVQQMAKELGQPVDPAALASIRSKVLARLQSTVPESHMESFMKGAWTEIPDDVMKSVASTLVGDSWREAYLGGAWKAGAPDADGVVETLFRKAAAGELPPHTPMEVQEHAYRVQQSAILTRILAMENEGVGTLMNPEYRQMISYYGTMRDSLDKLYAENAVAAKTLVPTVTLADGSEVSFQEGHALATNWHDPIVVPDAVPLPRIEPLPSIGKVEIPTPAVEQAKVSIKSLLSPSEVIDEYALGAGISRQAARGMFNEEGLGGMRDRLAALRAEAGSPTRRMTKVLKDRPAPEAAPSAPGPVDTPTKMANVKAQVASLLKRASALSDEGAVGQAEELAGRLGGRFTRHDKGWRLNAPGVADIRDTTARGVLNKLADHLNDTAPMAVATSGFVAWKPDDDPKRDHLGWLPDAAALAGLAALGIVITRGRAYSMEGLARGMREAVGRQAAKFGREAIYAMRSDGKGFLFRGSEHEIKLVDLAKRGLDVPGSVAFSIHSHPMSGSAITDYLNRLPSLHDIDMFSYTAAHNLGTGVIVPPGGTSYTVALVPKGIDRQALADTALAWAGEAPGGTLMKAEKATTRALADALKTNPPREVMSSWVKNVLEPHGVQVITDVADGDLDPLLHSLIDRYYGPHKFDLALSPSLMETGTNGLSRDTLDRLDNPEVLAKVRNKIYGKLEPSPLKVESVSSRETLAPMPSTITPQAISSAPRTLGEAVDWARGLGFEIGVETVGGAARRFTARLPGEASGGSPHGYTRLYRAEGRPTGKPLPDWVKESIADHPTGQWFYKDRTKAQSFAEDFVGPNSKITYIDVPTTEVENYLVANLPGKGREGNGARKWSASHQDEYFVPKELAAARLETSPLGTLLADGSSLREVYNKLAVGVRKVGESGAAAPNVYLGVVSTIPGSIIGGFAGKTIQRAWDPYTEDTSVGFFGGALLGAAVAGLMVASHGGKLLKREMRDTLELIVPPLKRMEPQEAAKHVGQTDLDWNVWHHMEYGHQADHMVSRLGAITRRKLPQADRRRALASVLNKYTPTGVTAEFLQKTEPAVRAAARAAGMSAAESERLWRGYLGQITLPNDVRALGAKTNLFSIAQPVHSRIGSTATTKEMRDALLGARALLGPEIGAPAKWTEIMRHTRSRLNVHPEAKAVADILEARDIAALGTAGATGTGEDAWMGTILGAFMPPEGFHSEVRKWSETGDGDAIIGGTMVKLTDDATTGIREDTRTELTKWRSHFTGMTRQERENVRYIMEGDGVKSAQFYRDKFKSNGDLIRAADRATLHMREWARKLGLPDNMLIEDYFPHYYSQRTLREIQRTGLLPEEPLTIPGHSVPLSKFFRSVASRRFEKPIGPMITDPLEAGTLYMYGAVKKHYLDAMLQEIDLKSLKDLAGRKPFWTQRFTRLLLDMHGIPTSETVAARAMFEGMGADIERWGNACGFNEHEITRTIMHGLVDELDPARIAQRLRTFEWATKIAGVLISPVVNLTQAALDVGGELGFTNLLAGYSLAGRGKAAELSPTVFGWLDPMGTGRAVRNMMREEGLMNGHFNELLNEGGRMAQFKTPEGFVAAAMHTASVSSSFLFDMAESINRNVAAGAAWHAAESGPGSVIGELKDLSLLGATTGGLLGFATAPEGEGAKRAAYGAAIGAVGAPGIAAAGAYGLAGGIEPVGARVARDMEFIKTTAARVFPTKDQLAKGLEPNREEMMRWFIRQVTDSTQFKYGKNGRPEFLRTPFGESMFALQTYTLNQGQFIMDRFTSMLRASKEGRPADLRLFKHVLFLTATGSVLTMLAGGFDSKRGVPYWMSRMGFGMLPFLNWNEQSGRWQVLDMVATIGGGPVIADIERTARTILRMGTDPRAADAWVEQLDDLSRQIVGFFRQAQYAPDKFGAAAKNLKLEALEDVVNGQVARGLASVPAAPATSAYRALHHGQMPPTRNPGQAGPTRGGGIGGIGGIGELGGL